MSKKTASQHARQLQRMRDMKQKRLADYHGNPSYLKAEIDSLDYAIKVIEQRRVDNLISAATRP